MLDIAEFLEKYPRSRAIHALENDDLVLLSKYAAPPDIVEFLRAEGHCAYQDDFLLTTLPHEQFQALSEWGLDGKRCFAFLRTALGSICYEYKGKIFQLDPISGHVYKGRFEFSEFMNLLATMDAFLESEFFGVYQQVARKRPLAFDEVYAPAPEAPRRGKLAAEHLEMAKMQEYLARAARSFGNKARRV